MPEPRYTCWVKGTDRESGPPRKSANWALARRGLLKVFDDRIECGDWIIPAAAVREAVLYETRQLFLIPTYVLQLSTDERTYQFGLNPWVRIDAHLPLEVRRERFRMGHSAYSLALRVIIAAYFVYVLWRWAQAS